MPLMAAAVEMLKVTRGELIWASPRELLNIFQADQIGCHVITVTNDVLKKLSLVGLDLDDYSLDTVKMFSTMQWRRSLIYGLMLASNGVVLNGCPRALL